MTGCRRPPAAPAAFRQAAVERRFRLPIVSRSSRLAPMKAVPRAFKVEISRCRGRGSTASSPNLEGAAADWPSVSGTRNEAVQAWLPSRDGRGRCRRRTAAPAPARLNCPLCRYLGDSDTCRRWPSRFHNDRRVEAGRRWRHWRPTYRPSRCARRRPVGVSRCRFSDPMRPVAELRMADDPSVIMSAAAPVAAFDF